MKRARLLRYARFQMDDYVVERGLMVLFLSVLNLVSPTLAIRNLPRDQRFLAPNSPLATEVVLIFGTLILLSVLFSSQEIISGPRKRGYYRLTLAKPVDPVLYYAQLFTVHLLGTALLISMVAAFFSLTAMPVPLGRIAVLASLAFVLFGGVGFLISALFNFDSVILIALVGLSLLGKGFAPHTGFRAKLANLLLPVDHLSALKPMIFGGGAVANDVAWVIGYGLAAFILGLLAVRYTQLAD